MFIIFVEHAYIKLTSFTSSELLPLAILTLIFSANWKTKGLSIAIILFKGNTIRIWFPVCWARNTPFLSSSSHSLYDTCESAINKIRSLSVRSRMPNFFVLHGSRWTTLTRSILFKGRYLDSVDSYHDKTWPESSK